MLKKTTISLLNALVLKQQIINVNILKELINYTLHTKVVIRFYDITVDINNYFKNNNHILNFEVNVYQKGIIINKSHSITNHLLYSLSFCVKYYHKYV